MNKITLFLMSQKGYACLNALINRYGSSVVDFIVVEEDKNIAIDYYQDITVLASKNNIAYFKRNEAPVIRTKYAIAISWRWLIPEIKDVQLIVLHDSLLPKYRGFAPLVSQLLNKEPVIGVTAFISNDSYDKGPIIGQMEIEVTYPIKIATAISKLSELYGTLIIKIIDNLVKGEPVLSAKQNESLATYSIWRDEDDYRIDWNESASNIRTFVDALGEPYRGASAMINNSKIRLHDVQEVDDLKIVNRDVGKVIFVNHGFPIVICGKGLLKIKRATFDIDGKSLLPLKKFRIRFK